MPYDADRSIDSLVLSLRALFDRRAAQGFSATIALLLGENHFSIEVADGQLQLARGEAERATVDTGHRPADPAALLYGGRPSR